MKLLFVMGDDEEEENLIIFTERKHLWFDLTSNLTYQSNLRTKAKKKEKILISIQSSIHKHYINGFYLLVANWIFFFVVGKQQNS